ncbi:MAG TPA: hypothetical protein DCZ94_10185 [Lentisphaeria bacterium]|nr:MAG: hypothetical protein A2X48_11060 [Lentisphaerae bacterium GWF2_49_21]HBC87312.1 hypothetical protein [Lentisphaeria bacterium]
MKKGFTLVELLVCVAILGILFSILLPTFGRVRQKSYQVVCMNDLRQIAIGFKSYMHDYDNEMPNTKRWLDDFSDIYIYVRKLDVFVCPATDTPALTSEADLVGGTDYYSGQAPTDIEKHANNGHGNNDYDFDMSNPSPITQAIIDAKTTERVLYDKYYRSHFNGFNLMFISDAHYETDVGVSEYWTLDYRGRIERSLDPFPDLAGGGGSSGGSSGGGKKK